MTFLQRLGLEHPIVQAPMAGGASTPQLAAAVSNAGALGSLGAGYLSPAQIRTTIDETRSLTSRPFAVNLFVGDFGIATPQQILDAQRLLAPYRAELGLPVDPATPTIFAEDLGAQLEAILDVRPSVFSFTFGMPEAAVLDECRRRGIVTIGTATNLAEALALDAAEVDGICVQGIEAGGHRGTFLGTGDDEFTGLVALLPRIAARVRKPLIAAGGLMNGQSIAAVLALGAQAAQLGTAFLLCPESGISPAYRRTLADPSLAVETAFTSAFSGRMARGIVNRFMCEMAPHAPTLPSYPVMNALTRDIRAKASAAGRAEFLSLWAGQGAEFAMHLPASQLVAQLVVELRSCVERLATTP